MGRGVSSPLRYLLNKMVKSGHIKASLTENIQSNVTHDAIQQHGPIAEIIKRIKFHLFLKKNLKHCYSTSSVQNICYT